MWSSIHFTCNKSETLNFYVNINFHASLEIDQIVDEPCIHICISFHI